MIILQTRSSLQRGSRVVRYGGLGPLARYAASHVLGGVRGLGPVNPRARTTLLGGPTAPLTIRSQAPLLRYVVRGLQNIYGANVCLTLSGTRRPRIRGLRRLLAGSFATVDGTTLALVTLDVNLLLRLFVRRLRASNMFRHRTLIKGFFAALLLRAPRLVQGCVIRIRGKISVGGNARSRELEFRFGTFASGQMVLRAATRRGIVGTVTGCLGVHMALWF